MLQQRTYSLWWMPVDTPYYHLKKIIEDLGNEYQTPIFEPHVTLIPDIQGSLEDILKKTQQLAAELKQVEINLQGFGYSNSYFQCLFFNVETTSEVKAANTQARKIFGRVTAPPYIPHLSILYSNTIPIATKKHIIEQIGHQELPQKFIADEIFVYQSGRPEEWQQVGKFIIGSTSR